MLNSLAVLVQHYFSLSVDEFLCVRKQIKPFPKKALHRFPFVVHISIHNARKTLLYSLNVNLIVLDNLKFGLRTMKVKQPES